MILRLTTKVTKGMGIEPQRRKDAEKEREEAKGIEKMIRLVIMAGDSSTALGMTRGELE